MYMKPPFYHVDRRGKLSVGDELYLRSDWEMYHNAGTCQIESDYIDRVREDFDNQLSNHGVRYAHSFYEIEQSRSSYLNNTYHTSFVPTEKPTKLIRVDNIFHEWVLEYVRRKVDGNHLSRFQSFFAYPTEEALSNSRNIDSTGFQIAKLEPSDFEIKDMSNYSNKQPGSIEGWLSIAEDYWKGKKTEMVDLEVQLHPPITVQEIINPT